jgi:hypothetical protein
MNKIITKTSYIIGSVTLVLLCAQVAQAASPATLQGEKQCVSQAVEAKVTSCEGGIAIDSKSRTAAEVGTSTKKPPAKKKAEVGPSLDRDMVRDILESAFSQRRKARAIDILKQEIQLITRLANGTPDSDPDKPEILKRLADAYKELYNAINFMARGLDEDIYKARQAGNKQQMNQTACPAKTT